jgi:hypothetical protein
LINIGKRGKIIVDVLGDDTRSILICWCIGDRRWKLINIKHVAKEEVNLADM